MLEHSQALITTFHQKITKGAKHIMNLIERVAVKQPNPEKSKTNLGGDLRQAIEIINADYQQMDWEDRAFLNQVLNTVLNTFKYKEVK